VELGVRYQDTVLGQVAKALPRRVFKTIVERYQGDRYVKGFSSWDHLIALIFAQLGGISSLRELATVWNAQAAHHYPLGGGRVCRSTLSDANTRRPSAIFTDMFAAVSEIAAKVLGGALPRHGNEVLRLIDATPIPLGKLCEWAGWNGRVRGMKAHLVYDPGTDRPVHLEITAATVNDIEPGRRIPIEPGATYVFDKAYLHYDWWHDLHQAGCHFVTRPKTNMALRVAAKRPVSDADREAAAIVSDSEVEIASKHHHRLPIRLRHIVLRRQDGTLLALLSNDLDRTAGEIAALYRLRWQIELLFRWIKQHLRIRRFLGRSENAIRLQIIAAMIAYLLLRIAANASRSGLLALRFADLVRARLFKRCPLPLIDKPDPKPSPHPRNQLSFAYA
jgi:putative transposase